MAKDDLESDDPAVVDRAERLKEALRHGGGNAAVARRIGMQIGTLNNYVAGRDMKASALSALADGCGVSIEWLATGRGTMLGTKGLGFPGFDGAMTEPINFFNLCLLLVTCREYFRNVGTAPTLSDAFEWISPLYPAAAKVPDRWFALVVDEASCRAAAAHLGITV